MKKTLLITTCFVLAVFLSFSQPSSWKWAKGSTGSGLQEGCSAATDKNSNVYIIGMFEGDTITFGSTTLVVRPAFDGLFIVKYDSTGNVLWAKCLEGTRPGTGYSITTDSSDNVYVTGNFADSITFGNITLLNADTLNSTGDIFIAKYDAAGNVLWAKTASGTNEDGGTSIATDAGGNIYIAGYFMSDSITFGSVTLLNSGPVRTGDIFMAKFDASGNLLWAKKAGGSSDDEALGIAADANGNAYVTGYFTSSAVQFGSGTLFNAGLSDIFIAKYDTAGNVLWAKGAGGRYNDIAYGVATDKSNNIYVTGGFKSDSVTFGSSAFYNPVSQGLGSVCFIVKYDASGNLLWAKEGSGSYTGEGYCIAVDSGNNVYVTGGFAYISDTGYQGKITFDYTTLIQLLGSTDPMFIVKFDSSGNVLCADALGSGGDDRNAVCVDHLGNAYITGDFYEARPFIVGNYTLTLTGIENIFVAKFNCGINVASDLENITESPTLLIFPNPFNSRATLKYSIPAGSKNAELIIYDLLGGQRNACKLNNADGQISINAGNLSSGIYFCSLVVDGKNAVTKKMVVAE